MRNLKSREVKNMLFTWTFWLQPEFCRVSRPSVNDSGYKLSPLNPLSGNTPNFNLAHSMANFSALVALLVSLVAARKAVGSVKCFAGAPQPSYCRLHGWPPNTGCSTGVKWMSAVGQAGAEIVVEGMQWLAADQLEGSCTWMSVKWTRPLVRLNIRRLDSCKTFCNK